MFDFTPLELQAIYLSIKVSGAAVLWSLPLGVAIAWILAYRDFPGKSIVDAVVHLPIVLPPVVVGYGLLVIMGRNGIVGQVLNDYLGLSFGFSWRGAALAAAVMAFPLMVRSIRLSMENVDSGLYAAARTLGAGPVKRFITLTLPLALPGIIVGCVLAFARSLGEFGATIAFVSNIPGETQTIPLALYTLANTPDGDQGALRLVIVAILLSLSALLISEFLLRKARNQADNTA